MRFEVRWMRHVSAVTGRRNWPGSLSSGAVSPGRRSTRAGPGAVELGRTGSLGGPLSTCGGELERLAGQSAGRSSARDSTRGATWPRRGGHAARDRGAEATGPTRPRGQGARALSSLVAPAATSHRDAVAVALSKPSEARLASNSALDDPSQQKQAPQQRTSDNTRHHVGPLFARVDGRDRRRRGLRVADARAVLPDGRLPRDVEALRPLPRQPGRRPDAPRGAVREGAVSRAAPGGRGRAPARERTVCRHGDVPRAHDLPRGAHDARLRALHGAALRQGLPLARAGARRAHRARGARLGAVARPPRGAHGLALAPRRRRSRRLRGALHQAGPVGAPAVRLRVRHLGRRALRGRVALRALRHRTKTLRGRLAREERLRLRHRLRRRGLAVRVLRRLLHHRLHVLRRASAHRP
mmetsp:Transcript_18272/g.57095  ORF Transcript_18272/g.57095 Transcript_18272/m.57095 type:complete len:412 (+) Transcript_18272:2121-3356(+)